MIIGVCGNAGSGKSEVAKHLVTNHQAIIKPFAAPLKAMLSAIGIDDEALYGNEKHLPSDALLGRTARHAMQTLGTEWGRNCIGHNFWAELWAEAIPTDAGLIVTDDIRFQNEMSRICQMGGVTISVVRPSVDDIVESAHASESELDQSKADYVIVNDGSLSDLKHKADFIVESVNAQGPSMKVVK